MVAMCRGAVAGLVATAEQAVAGRLSGRGGDRCDTAKVGECSFAAQPVWVFADGDK